MAKYTMNCADGHEPMMMEVEAGSDEEAMTMMLEKVKSHMMESHADMDMSDEDMKAKIMNDWSKSEM